MPRTSSTKTSTDAKAKESPRASLPNGPDDVGADDARSQDASKPRARRRSGRRDKDDRDSVPAAVLNLLAAMFRGINLPLIIVITLGVLPLGEDVVEVLWFPPAWKQMSLLIAGAVALAAYAYFRMVCKAADEADAALSRADAAATAAAGADNARAGVATAAVRGPEAEAPGLATGAAAVPLASAGPVLGYGNPPPVTRGLRDAARQAWLNARASFVFWLLVGIGTVVGYVILWHARTLPRPDNGPLSAAHVKLTGATTDAGYGSDRILLPLWNPRELRATLQAEHGWSNLIDTGDYLVKDLLEEKYRTLVALTTVAFLLLTILIIFTLTGAMTLAVRKCGGGNPEDDTKDAISTLVERIIELLRPRR